jgi:hypothetical protein
MSLFTVSLLAHLPLFSALSFFSQCYVELNFDEMKTGKRTCRSHSLRLLASMVILLAHRDVLPRTTFHGPFCVPAISFVIDDCLLDLCFRHPPYKILCSSLCTAQRSRRNLKAVLSSGAYQNRLA